MNLAEKFKHDFSKGIFRLYNKNGRLIFWEYSNKYWARYEHDENRNLTFFEDSNGDTWGKSKNKIPITDPNSIAQLFNHNFEDGSFKLYDKNGHVIFWEFSDKSWVKYERNKNGDIIFWENSDKRWERYEHDENGNITFWITSNGYTWGKPKNKLN